MLLALLPALALAQTPTITIRAGTVLDGRGGILRNTTIVIAGSRIARLDPALTAAKYDLSRLTVMPGGIDTHVHLTSHFDANGRAHNDPGGAEPLDQTVLYTAENAYRALMAGITTVQSIGSTLDRELHDPGPARDHLTRLDHARGRRRRRAAAHRPAARCRRGRRDQDPRLEEHPRGRRADPLGRRAAGRMRRGESAGAALRGPRARGGSRAARRAGRGDVDRARRTAR